jgi:phage shock protein A
MDHTVEYLLHRIKALESKIENLEAQLEVAKQVTFNKY